MVEVCLIRVLGYLYSEVCTTVTTVVAFVNETPACWCLMDERQKIPLTWAAHGHSVWWWCVFHRQLLFEVLVMIQSGINTLHVHNNCFLYVKLAFSGQVPSNTDFIVAFPHWTHFSFTKIHTGTKTKSWTPAELTVIMKYSIVV